MGVIKNLTGTPEGITLIVLLLIAFSTLIGYLVIGAAIFGVVVIIFWRTLLPGILMIAAALMFIVGAAKGNNKLIWVAFIMVALAVGISYWAGV